MRKSKENAFEDAIKILIDIRIVAAKNAVADGIEISRPLFIIFNVMIITMRDTINLNHQPHFVTDEINDIISNRHLPIEFPSSQTFGA